VLTRLSHEHAGNGRGTAVRGVIWSEWGIVAGGSEDFSLVGPASTRIAFHNASGEEIAGFRADVATADAAGGGALYADLRSSDGTGRFPDWLPLPRFALHFPTPMAMLEFVLGELFPSAWPRLVHARGAADTWTIVQRARWQALLGWYGDVTASGRSPWLALKSAVPPPRTFHPDAASPPRLSRRLP
jgi:hypothetical protein